MKSRTGCGSSGDEFHTLQLQRHRMGAKCVPNNSSSSKRDNDASNEGLKPNSVSMANELERESLKRENAALKERLKNTIAIQENLRDSEASLKRQLLSLRGKYI